MVFGEDCESLRDLKLLCDDEQKDYAMTVEKREKNVGYVLLAIGLLVVLISIVMSFFILMGVVSIPEVIKPPPSGTGTTDELVNIIANFGDIFLAFFLLIVMVYGGGVIMGRGVRLIKEIKLRAVREAIGEVSGEELEVKKKGKIRKKGK